MVHAIGSRSGLSLAACSVYETSCDGHGRAEKWSVRGRREGRAMAGFRERGWVAGWARGQQPWRAVASLAGGGSSSGSSARSAVHLDGGGERETDCRVAVGGKVEVEPLGRVRAVVERRGRLAQRRRLTQRVGHRRARGDVDVVRAVERQLGGLHPVQSSGGDAVAEARPGDHKLVDVALGRTGRWLRR